MIYNVFILDVLTKDPNNPLPGQESPKLLGEVITSYREQDIEEILAIKLTKNTLKYKVSQVNYNLEPNQYLVLNFMGSPYKL